MGFPVFMTVIKVTGAIAVPVVTALATRYAKRRMDMRIAAERQGHIEELALSAVRFSAQRFKYTPPGPDVAARKLEAAVDQLQRNARKAGITIEREDAEYEIEVAVHRMRGQWPEEEEPATNQAAATDASPRAIDDATPA